MSSERDFKSFKETRTTKEKNITNIHVVRLKKNATLKTLSGQTEEKLVTEKDHGLSI